MSLLSMTDYASESLNDLEAILITVTSYFWKKDGSLPSREAAFGFLISHYKFTLVCV
jgi:hypothetical protein